MSKLILLVVSLNLFSVLAFAQGNAFSFQGRLNDGANPANGRYDLQFKLFDAALGGTQIGPTVERPSVTLINGVFSTTLDFGAQAFQNPNSIFIEIAVRPFGSPNALTILGPRQQLTVVPFASRAQIATNADNAINANTAQNSLRLGGVLASDYLTAAQTNTGFIRNSTQTQTSSNFNISGTGVINGNLSVGGNLSLVGNQTVAGSSNLGTVQTSGNLTQSIAAYGAPKAMLYINLDGSILRCYNGVTGASTGNCGFISTRVLQGGYEIDFGFNITNKFIVMTPQAGGNSSRIGVDFSTANNFPTKIFVRCYFVNVASDINSTADNPFMIIVY